MDFILSSSVETHAAAVVVTSPVTEVTWVSPSAQQADLTGTAISEPDPTTQAELVGLVVLEPDHTTLAELVGTSWTEPDHTTLAELTATATTEPAENIPSADLSGTIIDGAYSPSLSLVGEAIEGVNVDLLGNILEEGGETVVDLTLSGEATTEGDVDIDLISVGTIFSAEPFYAEKLVVVEGNTNSVTLESLVIQDGSTDIYGTVIETNTAPTVDVISPLTIFSGGLLSNFDLSSEVISMEHNANVTLTAYSALLTVPFQQTNEVTVGGGTSLSLLATVENLNFMLTTYVADAGTIRYEVAGIDRNLNEGRIRIFPNKWTLSYINNPLDTEGNMNTVSSFLIPILESKYGADIFNKISLITARNPATGLLYNFVFQDGYTTPTGTVNDFELCYMDNGAFYPTPFMVKSITNEELEITWDLEQEV